MVRQCLLTKGFPGKAPNAETYPEGLHKVAELRFVWRQLCQTDQKETGLEELCMLGYSDDRHSSVEIP